MLELVVCTEEELIWQGLNFNANNGLMVVMS